MNKKVDKRDGDTIITKRVVTVYPNCTNIIRTRFDINYTRFPKTVCTLFSPIFHYPLKLNVYVFGTKIKIRPRALQS